MSINWSNTKRVSTFSGSTGTPSNSVGVPGDTHLTQEGRIFVKKLDNTWAPAVITRYYTNGRIILGGRLSVMPETSHLHLFKLKNSPFKSRVDLMVNGIKTLFFEYISSDKSLEQGFYF